MSNRFELILKKGLRVLLKNPHMGGDFQAMVIFGELTDCLNTVSAIFGFHGCSMLRAVTQMEESAIGRLPIEGYEQATNLERLPNSRFWESFFRRQGNRATCYYEHGDFVTILWHEFEDGTRRIRHVAKGVTLLESLNTASEMDMPNHWRHLGGSFHAHAN